MKSNDTTSRNGSAFWVALFALAVFLLGGLGILFVTHLDRGGPPVDEQRNQARLHTRQKLDVEDARLLSATEWADKEKGLARIPIQKAMDIAAVKLAAKAVEASAVAVPTPTPVPPPVEETKTAPAAEAPPQTVPAAPAPTPEAAP